MAGREGRTVGEDLRLTERALLDLLCSGRDAASASARAQLATATWAGYEHDACECSLIRSTADGEASRIQHDGGPFSVVEVSDGDETLGLLELWGVDGLLHSVSYMPFGDDHVVLPTRADFRLTLTARG